MAFIFLENFALHANSFARYFASSINITGSSLVISHNQVTQSLYPENPTKFAVVLPRLATSPRPCWAPKLTSKRELPQPQLLTPPPRGRWATPVCPPLTLLSVCLRVHAPQQLHVTRFTPHTTDRPRAKGAVDWPLTPQRENDHFPACWD